jgi:hypothetical protein
MMASEESNVEMAHVRSLEGAKGKAGGAYLLAASLVELDARTKQLDIVLPCEGNRITEDPRLLYGLSLRTTLEQLSPNINRDNIQCSLLPCSRVVLDQGALWQPSLGSCVTCQQAGETR